MSSPPDATLLLRRVEAGDAEAANELFAVLQQELRALAGELMRAERAGHTLQPTALVHEAWLKLFGGATVHASDRAHFLRAAARAMRHVLVDHARGKRCAKRDAGKLEALDLTLAAVEGPEQVELVALDEALLRFAELDPVGARVVELRFFAGLGNDEVAAVLGVSTPTVERAWRAARLWLSRALGGETGVSA
ncbi:MAG: RNA polymerase subunit sigma-70 [Planctomycetes bacterium]|nr:RNA polymerase subunit sigma-70 [Planctomycetota bacterium]